MKGWRKKEKHWEKAISQSNGQLRLFSFGICQLERTSTFDCGSCHFSARSCCARCILVAVAVKLRLLQHFESDAAYANAVYTCLLCTSSNGKCKKQRSRCCTDWLLWLKRKRSEGQAVGKRRQREKGKERETIARIVFEQCMKRFFYSILLCSRIDEEREREGDCQVIRDRPTLL